MKAKNRLCLASVLALLVALAVLPFSAAATEEPYGSGCNLDLLHPVCRTHKDQARVSCGVQVLPEMSWLQGVRVATYELATDAEIGHCLVTGSTCDPDTPDSVWLILELEVPCGNGKIFWRNLSMVSVDKLSQRSYSEKTLEEFGLRNSRTLLAMAEFQLLVAAGSPYPAEPPQ